MLHSIFCGRTLSRVSLRFELLHGFDQPGHALDGHGVIDAGAHAADEAVALEVHKTLRGGEFDERRAGFYGGVISRVPPLRIASWLRPAGSRPRRAWRYRCWRACRRRGGGLSGSRDPARRRIRRTPRRLLWGRYFAIPSASNCFMASTSRVTPSTGMAL